MKVESSKRQGEPEAVIDRAQRKLRHLEEEGQTSTSTPVVNNTTTDTAYPGLLMDYLAQIDPDATNPRQALDILYRIKQLEKHG